MDSFSLHFQPADLNSIINEKGCLQSGEEWLEMNLVMVAGVAVGIAFLQVIFHFYFINETFKKSGYFYQDKTVGPLSSVQKLVSLVVGNSCLGVSNFCKTLQT